MDRWQSKLLQPCYSPGAGVISVDGRRGRAARASPPKSPPSPRPSCLCLFTLFHLREDEEDSEKRDFEKHQTSLTDPDKTTL